MERPSIVRTRENQRPGRRRKPSTPISTPGVAETTIFFGIAALAVGALLLQPESIRVAFDALTSHFSEKAMQTRAEKQLRQTAYESARGFIRERLEPSWTNHFSMLDTDTETGCRHRYDGLWEARGFAEFDSPRGRRREMWFVVLDPTGKEQRYLDLGGQKLGYYEPEPERPLSFSERIKQSGYEPAR